MALSDRRRHVTSPARAGFRLRRRTISRRRTRQSPECSCVGFAVSLGPYAWRAVRLYSVFALLLLVQLFQLFGPFLAHASLFVRERLAEFFFEAHTLGRRPLLVEGNQVIVHVSYL